MSPIFVSLFYSKHIVGKQTSKLVSVLLFYVTFAALDTNLRIYITQVTTNELCMIAFQSKTEVNPFSTWRLDVA